MTVPSAAVRAPYQHYPEQSPTPATPAGVDPGTADRSTTVHVRYFAAARAATGVDEEWLQLPGAASVDDVVAALRERHPDRLPRVLDAASYLRDGVAVRDTAAELVDGTQLDVLPPFAGG